MSPCIVHVACCLYIQARFHSLTMKYLIATECCSVLLTLSMHARGLPYILGLCVCLSVTTLAASVPAYTCNHLYSRISLMQILIRSLTSVQKIWREKATMRMIRAHYGPLSGPVKGSSYVKDN